MTAPPDPARATGDPAALAAIAATLSDHRETIARLAALAPEILAFARLIHDCTASGGTVWWFGNGGSAADAQHLSAELVGRYVRDRRGLRSVALSTDTSLLTAVANDYGYERIFARQLETLARPGDVAVAISTSGRSANIVAGAAAAHAAGAKVVTLTGAAGGAVEAHATLRLRAPSTITARVQECHGLIGHTVCELIDGWIEGAPHVQ